MLQLHLICCIKLQTVLSFKDVIAVPLFFKKKFKLTGFLELLNKEACGIT